MDFEVVLFYFAWLQMEKCGLLWFKSIYKIRTNKLYRMNYKLDQGDI